MTRCRKDTPYTRAVSQLTSPRLGRQRWIATYLVAGVIFALVDGIWLGVVASNLNRNAYGDLARESFSAPAAVAFYLLYVAGLVHFVIAATGTDRAWRSALRDAALFGLVTYATYDLTALAVIRGFPAGVALVDIVWGAVLCTVTTAATVTIMRRSGRRDTRTELP